MPTFWTLQNKHVIKQNKKKQKHMWKIGALHMQNVVIPRVGYRASFHEECSQHHGHKGDLEKMPMPCGAIGKRAQVILVWVRASGVENTSHPRRLGVIRVRP
jgi:hypothetical protein